MRAYLLVIAFMAALAAAVAQAASRHTYPVDWRVRYLGEHAHVHRLLPALSRTRSELHAARAQLRTRRTQAVEQPAVEDWRAKQIAAAEVIGHEAGADPWPNCPDPIWNGAASWDETVACENSGNWLDSPGWYRCGLQFDPMWETRFGRLCP